MNPTILLLCIKISFHFYYSSHIFDLFSGDYLLVSRSQVTWSGSVSGLRIDDPVAPTGLPPLLVPWAVWAVTESANTEEEPSRALPFWVEDRIGEGEKRLWGHCWLRGDFMRRTEAGGVDLVRLTGQDLLSAVGCRQGFLWWVILKSKAMMRACFQCRLWQFLTHTLNGGWMWQLCFWEGQAAAAAIELLNHVRLFVTLWTEACQTSLFFTITQNLFKPMSIELMMPSNHLILCCPLLLPSIFPSTRVFSNESVLHIRWPKYWSFSFSISPSSEYILCWFPSGLTGVWSPCCPRDSPESSPAPQFERIRSSVLSLLYGLNLTSVQVFFLIAQWTLQRT